MKWMSLPRFKGPHFWCRAFAVALVLLFIFYNASAYKLITFRNFTSDEPFRIDSHALTGISLPCYGDDFGVPLRNQRTDVSPSGFCLAFPPPNRCHNEVADPILCSNECRDRNISKSDACFSRKIHFVEVPFSPEEVKEDYNIVLLSVDTLRADFLPLWPDSKETTLKAWLQNATTVFASAITAAPWTRPSHASLLTGQNPLQTGIFDLEHWVKYPLLPDFLPSRYEKVGFVENRNLSPRFEGDADFGFSGSEKTWDTYVSSMDKARGGSSHKDVQKFLLSRSQTRPFFLFYHTNEVHDYKYLRGNNSQPWEASESLELYRQAVKLASEHLDASFKLFPWQNTIVVLFGDHGEGFDEANGYIRHTGNARQDLIHVPLVFWIPERLREKLKPPHRIDTPCSLIDVAPTLLSLLGFDSSKLGQFFPGKNLFKLPPHRRLFVQDFDQVLWRNRKLYRDEEGTFLSAGDTSNRTARHTELIATLAYPLKHIYRRKDKEIWHELFNLAYDKEEAVNLENAQRMRVECIHVADNIFIRTSSHSHSLSLPALLSPFFRHCPKHIPRIHFSPQGSLWDFYLSLKLPPSKNITLVLDENTFLPPGWRRHFGYFTPSHYFQNFSVVGGAYVEKDRKIGRWADPLGYHFYPPSSSPPEIDFRVSEYPDYSDFIEKSSVFQPAVVSDPKNFVGWLLVLSSEPPLRFLVVDSYFSIGVPELIV